MVLDLSTVAVLTLTVCNWLMVQGPFDPDSTMAIWQEPAWVPTPSLDETLDCLGWWGPVSR